MNDERNNINLSLEDLDSASGGAGDGGASPKFGPGSLVCYKSHPRDAAYRVRDVVIEGGEIFYNIYEARDFAPMIYKVPESELKQQGTW